MRDPGAGRRGAGLVADLFEHEAALRAEFFRLPGLCRGKSAVVDRRGDLPQHGCLIGAERAERHRAGQRAFGDAYRGRGDVDVEACGEHGGMALDRGADRVVARARQQPIDRLRKGEPRRRVADHLRIGRLADRKIDLGGVEVCLAAADTRLGLRGIGRRHVARREAFARDVEGRAQEVDIGALRFDQRLVRQHVGVDRHRVEQHALAEIAQRLAAGLHLQFGDAHAVGGAVAVEQDLRDREPDGPGPQRRGLHGISRQQVAHRLQAAAQARDDRGTIGGERLRDVLVGRALPGTVGIQQRIGLIRLDQRFGHRLGEYGRGCEHRAGKRHEASGRARPPRADGFCNRAMHSVSQRSRTSAPADVLVRV